jgi:hypothetical protein
MSEAPKEVLINGTSYKIGLHGGRDGLRAALQVQSVLQSEITGIQGSMHKALTNEDKAKLQELESDVDAKGKDKSEARKKRDEKERNEIMLAYQDVMISGAESMLKNLDPDKMYDLLLMLCENVYLSQSMKPLKDDAVFDAHFAGKYKNMYPLAREVIEANGFLDLNLDALIGGE